MYDCSRHAAVCLSHDRFVIKAALILRMRLTIRIIRRLFIDLANGQLSIIIVRKEVVTGLSARQFLAAPVFFHLEFALRSFDV